MQKAPPVLISPILTFGEHIVYKMTLQRPAIEVSFSSV
jgi:hypothetical protein